MVQVCFHDHGVQVGEHPCEMLSHTIDGAPHLLVEQTGLIQEARDRPGPCKIECGDVGHSLSGGLAEDLQRERVVISTNRQRLHMVHVGDLTESSIHPLIRLDNEIDCLQCLFPLFSTLMVLIAKLQLLAHQPSVKDNWPASSPGARRRGLCNIPAQHTLKPYSN